MPILSDVKGKKLLVDIENASATWEDVLVAAGIDRYDFANWLSEVPEREAKFAKLRNQGGANAKT